MSDAFLQVFSAVGTCTAGGLLQTLPAMGAAIEAEPDNSREDKAAQSQVEKYRAVQHTADREQDQRQRR